MFYLGIDIGSVSVKLAAVGHPKDRESFEEICRDSESFYSLDEYGSTLTKQRLVLVSTYKRIKGEPVQTTSDLLEELLKYIAREQIGGVRVTGSGGRLVSELLRVPFENEFRAVAKGVGTLHPEVRTIFEMGGDTSKYILIEVDEANKIVSIADYEKNGDCAAGTGSFMDQQASRLRYAIEEVGDIVMSAQSAATIAGRCSVFAKSDMIHAQQKGYQPAQILRGLCDAVVRNFKGSITKGKSIIPKVAFIGGVAANKGVVQAMRAAFGLQDDELIVPGYYAWMGAIGAALYETESGREDGLPDIAPLEEYYQRGSANFPVMEPLSTKKIILLRDRVKPYSFEGKTLPIDVYLGIDIGSISTNLAVIDENGDVVKEIYLRTESRPIEVVNNGLREIEEEVGDKIRIRGVGTTGSGRELIGELIGADTINDEITAHKTGATHVGEKLLEGSTVDTIFDIGGQDSKFISIEDDIVVDFTMNEACAAGTGSFLEEQAEKLSINIKGEFAELALSSEKPIRLGERCTVFMERDLNPYLQRGAKKEDLAAGLAYSIVLNYLNRVVRGRKIGDVIYFQGGTAYNDSVAAAFATILDKEIVVPPYNGVIGAIGMAFLAQEKILQSKKQTSFRGYHLDKIDYTIREFTCKACSNFCEIQEFRVEENKTYWGDKCSDQFRKRVKVDKEPIIPDLIALREKLLMEDYTGGIRGKTKIGLARSMYFYDQFPFWHTFLRETGFDVLISGSTSRNIVMDGIDATMAEPCFPIKVAHGHTFDLIKQGVDYIFQPNIIDAETIFDHTNSFLCPWGQTLPFVLRSAIALNDYRNKFLSPTIHFRGGAETVKKELRDFAKEFDVSRKEVDRAVDLAYDAQQNFIRKLQKAGREALETLKQTGELGVVMVGRSYNVNDRGVNLSIPSKLRDYYSVNVIPMDFLDMDDIDIRDINNNMFWNYGRKIIQVAKIVRQYPNLHIIYITNFKCGPDSYIKHFIWDASGKPYLSLQFDGHSNDAGIITRCEAYLDSKGFLRWWMEKNRKVA